MKKVLVFALIVSALASCKKSEDTEAPVISFVRVNGVSADEHELEAGEVMTVTLRLQDNEELNQVKVGLHAADDGHTHEGETGEEEEVGENIGVWSDSRILNLEGTSADRTVTFTVPSDIAGYWHLEVLLIDRQGNESEEYITTIHVENPNLPVITMTTNPAPVDGHVELAPGGILNLSFEVTDNDGVAQLHLEVEDDNGAVVYEQDFTPAGAVTFNANDLIINFPDAGHYHLHVEATDGAGMTNMSEVEIHVE
jgi:hypothetical protein